MTANMMHLLPLTFRFLEDDSVRRLSCQARTGHASSTNAVSFSSARLQTADGEGRESSQRRAESKAGQRDDRTTDYGASTLISCLARRSKSSSRLSQRFSALPPFLRSAAANPVGLRLSL